jgi:hypothetical protein
MKKLCFLICLVISILLATGCVNQLSANTAEGSDTFSKSTDSAEPVYAANSGDQRGSKVYISEPSENTGKTGKNSDETEQSSDRTGGGSSDYSDIAVLKPSEIWIVNNHEGVVMTAKEGKVSPTGLTVVFKNITDNELLYGEFYVLEMKTDGGWCQVPVAFDGNYGFNSIGYILEPDSSRE